MGWIDLAVFVSIAGAIVAWSLAEWLRSRTWWTAGALLAWIHSISAFGLVYLWSHDTARRMTMQQTAALTGIEFEGGLYVNYAFLMLWLADAAWWCWSPRTYQTRPALITVTVRGFIFFIIFNGAVVFADGWARVIGIVSTSLVLATWLLKHWSRRGASTTAGSF